MTVVNLQHSSSSYLPVSLRLPLSPTTSPRPTPKPKSTNNTKPTAIRPHTPDLTNSMPESPSQINLANLMEKWGGGEHLPNHQSSSKLEIEYKDKDSEEEDNDDVLGNEELYSTQTHLSPKDEILPISGPLREMKLRGVGGHLTSLVGVVEGCPVGFKGKMEKTGVTFCVVKGVKHLILGRPFLMDLEARLNYVMGDARWLKLPLYVPEESSKFQKLSRKEEGVRHPKPNMDQGWLYQYNDFLMNGWAEKEKEERIKTVEKIKEYKKVNKIEKKDKKVEKRKEKKKVSFYKFVQVILDYDGVYRQGKIEEEELRLLGKSRNCSWVGLADHYHDNYGLPPVAHFSNREEKGDTASPVIKGKREDKKKWSEWEFPALQEGEERRLLDKSINCTTKEDRRLLDKSINCTTYGAEVLKRVVVWVYGTQEETEEEGSQSRGWEGKQEKEKPWKTWEFKKREEGRGLRVRDWGRRRKEEELELLDKSGNFSWVGEVAHNPCWKELGKEGPNME
ncbi:hypothetical protein PPACK8108_LOCUS16900 [Phakopsora pachyrhizi]|uniref:Uncharacterized protein n=1 Tax=Phakopsora pachyrhizi TaxID=170000 RepID=A0AAV0BC37_PHAPC|nr:hypothetical protein PPACK8108_LOCUS16900 [Phakopsora pachyrhizi]